MSEQYESLRQLGDVLFFVYTQEEMDGKRIIGAQRGLMMIFAVPSEFKCPEGLPELVKRPEGPIKSSEGTTKGNFLSLAPSYFDSIAFDPSDLRKPWVGKQYSVDKTIELLKLQFGQASSHLFVWSRNKWNHRLLFYDQEKCKNIPGTLIDVGNSKAKLYQQVQLQKLNVLYKDI